MKVARNRSELELDIAQALSRHIGYTSAAYDLDRIVSVLDVFKDAPSIYEPEIVSGLIESEEGRGPKRKAKAPYLSEVVNFAVSMRIIEQVGPKSSRIQKFAPTLRGRSLKAAQDIGDEKFYNYFLSRTVLFADADSLYCVLKCLSEEKSKDLEKFYKSFHENLREIRFEWLCRAFPERILLKRIADHVSWLKPSQTEVQGYSIEPMSLNTARHHATPRKGWVKFLAMCEEGSGDLTEFGKTVYNSLSPTGKYFWLGPDSETQQQLKIPESKQMEGVYKDNFIVGESNLEPTASQIVETTEQTAEIMKRGYYAAKLIHAPQASLELPIEFISFCCYRDGLIYDWHVILDAVFQKYRSELQRFSARVGDIGFYKKL